MQLLVSWSQKIGEGSSYELLIIDWHDELQSYILYVSFLQNRKLKVPYGVNIVLQFW
jgi:hypothetical protein